MIPHHQVAIDMSNLLVSKTKQDYEIWEMNIMKNKLSDTIFSDDIWTVDTKLEYHKPNMSKSKDGKCNPLFFKPNDHSKMMKHMKINDKSYLEHMIPHHQVAIDMSKRLLLHTNHSYLLYFCRKLILDQQAEIYLMNHLLKNEYNHKSSLLN